MALSKHVTHYGTLLCRLSVLLPDMFQAQHIVLVLRLIASYLFLRFDEFQNSIITVTIPGEVYGRYLCFILLFQYFLQIL